MRILFLSQLLPLPLDAGAKIRSYYVLKYLAEAGHEITLVCFVRPEDRDEHIQTLREVCRSIHTVPLVRSRFNDLKHGLGSLVTAIPFLIARDRIPEMTQSLKKISDSRSFDALHADQLWMASYGLEHEGPSMRVLDQHNAVFKIPLQLEAYRRNPLIRFFLNREASRLSAYERSACKKFDRVVWVTEEDRNAVIPHENGNVRKHSVIPIGADPVSQTPLIRPRPFRVTFLGGMHWPPNAEGIAWFAEKIWPGVSEAVPDAILTLIGKGAPAKILRSDVRARIHITGYLSDIRQYLQETAAFIVPLRTGAGMRVKILDAWCWGLPVISTSVGAEGIKTVHNENLLIADDESSFAECLLQVLRDSSLANRLSENGRSTVESQYDWRKIYPAWDQIYH